MVAKTKQEQAGDITVRLVGSPIRRDGRQREYLKSLGLGRLGSQKTLKDTPAVRGLIRKVSHMVELVG